MIERYEKEWKTFDIGLEAYKNNWNNHINQTYTYKISKTHKSRFNWEVK